MADLAIQYLRGDVVRGSTDGPLFLAFEFQFGGQTKISNLDLHFFVQEEIAQFHVSVDDPVGMQELESCDHLGQIALDLKFCESLPTFDEFVECLVGAQF